MENRPITTKSFQTPEERRRRMEFVSLFQNAPIPDDEILQNLGLFIRRQDLTRILFMNELYQKILDVHGIIIEFGVRWGQNMALFESFRGIYEPFNHNRKIVGFDTFEGFPSVTEKDGTSDIISTGSMAVTREYEGYLARVLKYHELESPISHIPKYRIMKGDATVEIRRYLDENPETIVALAYFDFDIYEPTKICLEAIRDHVTKGTVIGFDELNVHDYPGETQALRETFGLDRFRIKRSRYSSVNSYLIIE
jgi:hypothetical protein